MSGPACSAHIAITSYQQHAAQLPSAAASVVAAPTSSAATPVAAVLATNHVGVTPAQAPLHAKPLIEPPPPSAPAAPPKSVPATPLKGVESAAGKPSSAKVPLLSKLRSEFALIFRFLSPRPSRRRALYVKEPRN
jgi:hypothetical protein